MIQIRHPHTADHSYSIIYCVNMYLLHFMKVFFQINQLPFAFSVGSHLFACIGMFSSNFTRQFPRLPSPKYALLSSPELHPCLIVVSGLYRPNGVFYIDSCQVSALCHRTPPSICSGLSRNSNTLALAGHRAAEYCHQPARVILKLNCIKILLIGIRCVKSSASNFILVIVHDTVI